MCYQAPGFPGAFSLTRLFRLYAVLLFSAILAPLAPLAQAADYPDYNEIYVNDFAGLLSEQEADGIRSKLKELRAQHGIEFTVVTIHQMWDYGHTGEIEPFATGLFNAWGVGDAERNDGIMMLVARDDRKMRIEVGSGYGDSKNAPMQRIIDEEILPEFRQDRYAEGIRRGTDAVIRDLTGFYPGEESAGGLERVWMRAERTAERYLLAIAAGFTAALGALAFLIRRWLRNRPRHCPVDGSSMVRLDEFQDDAHLDSGQQTEERLASKDYDVWVCQDCSHVTVEGYRGWFSRFGACRSCGYRTLEGDTTILKSATTSSTGLKRIDYHCHHCGDAYSVTRVIPKKSKSSSSSSSFGGGSSSGGGASGSW